MRKKFSAESNLAGVLFAELQICKGETEMKIIVARKEFADALKNVLKAVAVKSQTPILSGIYLKAENSTLELQATNNSVGIISKVPAVVG